MKLTYDEFKARIVEDFKDYLPSEFEDYEVVVDRVTKNNGCVMEGVTLVNKNLLQNTSTLPILYLDGLYDEYLEMNKSYQDVLKVAVVTFVRAMRTRPTAFTEKLVEAMDNPELFKKMVQFRLVNEELNQTYMENSPHRNVHDLAIIYMLSSPKTPELSVKITNEIMESVGLTEEELYVSAMANLKSERFTLKNMSEYVINNMKKKISELPESLREVFTEKLSELQEELCGMSETYILQNKSGILGSRSILNSELLEDIRKELGENYYILPSSIHEVIVVKEGIKSPEELREIVYNTNKGILEEKDFLSDNVYYYDGMLKMHDSLEIEW